MVTSPSFLANLHLTCIPLSFLLVLVSCLLSDFLHLREFTSPPSSPSFFSVQPVFTHARLLFSLPRSSTLPPRLFYLYSSHFRVHCPFLCLSCIDPFPHHCFFIFFDAIYFSAYLPSLCLPPFCQGCLAFIPIEFHFSFSCLWFLLHMFLLLYPTYSICQILYHPKFIIYFI